MMLENGPDLSVNTLFDAFLQDSQILQYWSHIAVFLHIIPHSPVLARMKPLYECFPCQFLSISNFKMKMSTNAITVSEYMARHWFRIFEKYTSSARHGFENLPGTWVWVRRVWVRVQYKVPVENPHPCNGFRGFSWGTITILIPATVQFMPHVFKKIFKFSFINRKSTVSDSTHGLPIILLGSYLPGKPRSLLFRHLFAILKAAKSSGPSVLLHIGRTM